VLHGAARDVEPRTPVAVPSIAAAPSADGVTAAQIKPLPQAIAELEARAIHDALAATGGNKLAASRLLGIARATLYEKLALQSTRTEP